MKLTLKRFTPKDRTFDTLGLLSINDEFVCFTLEDRFQEKKVQKLTRIPEGTYPLTLRTFGGHHEKYLLKYGADFHKGMIQLQNVQGFTDILIHVGNVAADTDGCLLIGAGVEEYSSEKGASLVGSTLAYERLYPIIRDAILKEATYVQIE